MEKERIDREELWSLISRAKQDRNAVCNPEWIMAYNQLIFACSTLDAFIARSSETPTVDLTPSNRVPSGDMGGPIE